MTAAATPDRSQQTLHLIGHSHIDPVWLWQWPEGFAEVKATFRSALDRLAEFDDFVYTASSAAFYDWIERTDAAMFAEIKQRVTEGRWQVVGGWWVEPDCNVPCGESFARQALIGQRYFAEKLGVTASVGFNPDSFGHSGMLPQILAKSGLSAYVFMRPGPHEQGLPGRVFWWESDDGSRVLAFRIAYEYGSWGKAVDTHVRRCADEMKSPVDHLMCFYGVGDHGGGPTVENLTSIRRLREDPDLPELVFSHPERFFAAVREAGVDLPVVHSELQHHASGCYATHSGIKRWNRRAENLLLDAERLCAVANRVTGHRTTEDFTRAWKNVLFNQFHDLLPGTSIEPAYTDARDELGEATAVAARAAQAALQSLTWRIDIAREDGTTPIVVWNTHSWPNRQCVELELARLGDDDALVDDAAGERGWPNDPTRRVQWREAFAKGLALAARLDCPVVNVLAGNRVADCGLGEQRACLRDNLAWALPFARRQGRVLLLEVLNDRDTPRYLLTHLDDAADLVRRAGSPALRLQFDSYHVGRLYGPESVPQRFAAVATLVGHVQVADVPGRHEPGTGQIDFAAFFAELRRAGYRGAVAAEYVPTAGTTAGLGWLDRPWW